MCKKKYFIFEINLLGWIAVALLGILLTTSPIFAEGEEPPILPDPQDAVVLFDDAAAADENEFDAEELPPVEEGLSEGDLEEPPTVLPEDDVNPILDVTIAPLTVQQENDDPENIEIVEVVDEIADNALDLVDVNGETLDMASEASAAALQGADPYFYVGTTMYQFLPDGMTCPGGSTTCWVSAPGDNPIQDAIEYINANGVLPTNRMIYVEAGTYTGNVSINTSSEIFSSLLNGLIGAGSSTTTIAGDVFINQNIAGFTLSGFTILGGLTVTDSIGTLVLNDLDITNPDGNGIYVHDQVGNVEITNTRSSGNYANGADIHYETTSGTVKVSNSSFDDNGTSLNDAYDFGLSIKTSSAVTLEGISASRNLGRGIEVFGFSSLSIKNVVANGNAEPYNKYWTGEGIYAFTASTAAVTLENIQANYNADDGIYVSTNGSVKAKNIEAVYNTIRYGTTADHYKVSEFLSDDVAYDEWRFEGTDGLFVRIYLETLAGLNDFDPLVRLYDSAYNLLVEDDNSKDGWNSKIETTLTADGVYYLRVYRASGDAASRYELSLNFDGKFENYYSLGGSGLSFWTWDGTGTFRLDNGYFNQNADDGLYVNNRNTVTVSSITSSNNGDDGIYINKSGSIWDCPEGGGACILLGYGGLGSVNIISPTSTGWLTANSVFGNGGTGVYIYARGNINVANIDAYDNTIGGLRLNNCLRDSYTGTCLGAGSIKISTTLPNWSNYISANSGNGVEIDSAGSVTIQDVTAKFNGIKGVYVDTLSNISLLRVIVDQNFDTGAYLTTLSSPSARNVSIMDSTFNGNDGTGLIVKTAGTITTKGVSASNNTSPISGTIDTLPVTVYDQIYEGDVAEVYYFYGQSGQWVDLILQSTDFDAYLELNDNGGDPISFNDNSYGGTDSRIIYSLPYTGWYQLQVSYIGSNMFGDYILSVNDEAHTHSMYPGSGMELDNSSGMGGVAITTTKNNPINSFDDNGNYGLKITSNGSVLINGAGANRNYLSGINVVTLNSVTIQDTSKTPSSSFNDNGLYGIYVHTLKAIKLNGVSASGNVLNGADLENCFYSGDLLACSGSGSITVAIKNNFLAEFSNNGGYGVKADASGSILITNISADENGLSGLYLRNDYGTGAISIQNRSKIPASTFNANGSYGIYARSYKNIFLYSVSASSNPLSGAYLDNCREIGGYCMGTGTVTVQSASSVLSAFSSNGDHGILAFTNGNIKLTNLSACENGLSGVIARNNYSNSGAGVTLTSSGSVINQFNNNGTAGEYIGSAPAYRVGLLIDSRGTISLSNMEAGGNLDGGIDSAWYGSQYAGSGLLVFNNNGERAVNLSITNGDFSGNDMFGVRALSFGTITLKNITANSNGNTGAQVINNYEGFTGNVTLLTTRGGWNTFNDNNGGGLQIETNGAVTFRDVDALNNAMLSNTFSTNGISTASVREFYNDALGADVWEFYALAGVPLTIQLDRSWSPSGEVFDPYLELYDDLSVLLSSDDNTGGSLNAEISYTPSADGWYYLHVSGLFNVDGFYLLGINDPTWSDVTELYADGVSISAGKNVSLLGSAISTFDSNSQTGLKVETAATISLQKLQAYHNGIDGTSLNNLDGTGNVIVSGPKTSTYSNFGDNGQDGLLIYTNGAVTLNNLWAEDNGRRGILAGSSGIPVGKTIKISNVLAIGNSSIGLETHTYGLITVSKSHALDNGSDGMYLSNEYGTSAITVTGDSILTRNGADGLRAVSQSHITLNKLTAENNGNNGINVNSALGNVTLSNINVKYSAWNGLSITGNAKVTLTNIASFANGDGTDGDGINILADTTTLITFRNSSFVANEGSGIEISGAVGYPTLISTFYFGNDVDGDSDLNLYLH